MEKILSAVEYRLEKSYLFYTNLYFHQFDIMHRDLKPENLILRNKLDDIDIVIADFGLADFYNPKGIIPLKICRRVLI